MTTALRLAHSLGASIEQLTARIYWTPGQIVRGTDRPSAERLRGFFQVLAGNESAFEPAPSREPVGGRRETAALFGKSVRDARERRHLTQAELARSAGLSKNGLSLIERGIRETSVEVFSRARPLARSPAWLPARGDRLEPRPVIPTGSGSAWRMRP